MQSFTRYLAAAAAIGALAVPAAAQSSYPYQSYPVQVPQPYPGQPGYGYQQQAFPQQAYPGYPQPAYAYGQQGYAQNPVGQVIDSLLGNRYNVTDRQAVSQCASAAMTQAVAQYGNGYRAYNNNGYGRGYNGQMRVTSITDVQRRNNGLRVSGLMSSGYGGRYANQYGYQNRNTASGDLSFRCNVAYNGAVTNIRIGRNMAYDR
jgi:hypothetical protein